MTLLLQVCSGGVNIFVPKVTFLVFFDRDAVVVAVGDCLTSIFGGVVIFTIIGYMAHELSVDIKDVAAQGRSTFHVYDGSVCPVLHFLSDSCWIVHSLRLSFQGNRCLFRPGTGVHRVPAGRDATASVAAVGRPLHADADQSGPGNSGE